MKKSLLRTVALFLSVIILASCSRITPLNGRKSISNPVAEVANESSSLFAAEEEKKDITEENEIIAAQITAEDLWISDETNTHSDENKNEVSVTESIKDEELYCTLSVVCQSVFENMDTLKPEKKAIIPQSGIIFPETKVVYYEGESAFNVLTRELKKNKIHIDFVSAPIYNTIYIKGISNLYEKDCGDLSGWLYMVNGTVPGYGCSLHIIKPGDKIEFLYTCHSGRDVAK